MTFDELVKVCPCFGDTITVVCGNGRSFTGDFNDFERADESSDGLEYIAVNSDHNKSVYIRLADIKDIAIFSKCRRPER